MRNHSWTVLFCSFLSGSDVQLANFAARFVHRIVTNRRDAVHQTHGQLKCLSASEGFSKSIHGIWFCCTTGDFASMAEDGQQSFSREQRASI